MNWFSSRTARVAAAVLFAVPFLSGFSYEGSAPQLSVTLPADLALHGQGIWASGLISVNCTPVGEQVFSAATLTQVQEGRTVQAFSSHSDSCTGAPITVPLQLFAAPRVMRTGKALLQEQVSVNNGGNATVSRTVTLTTGKDTVSNSASTRIGATGTILSRVPVVIKVPLSLQCPVSDGTANAFVSVSQATATGAIIGGSTSFSEACTGQWVPYSIWVTIPAGRWHAGPAWAVANDASRPLSIVMGGKP